MASIIRIKRSSVSGNPTTLAAGEIAYSGLTDNGSNGGDRLYIGMGTETAGNAANHIVIGGKYFTDMLDHTPGVLTATSAIIVDANKKIDDLLVDNLELNGNTISSTDTNGNVVITPNGTGKTVITNPYVGDTATSLAEYIYDTVGGAVTGGTGITITNSDVGNTSTVSITNTTVTAGSYGSSTAIPTFTVNAQGQLTAAGTASLATNLNIAGDTGTDAVALLSDTLTFAGTNGLSAAVTNNTVTVTSNAASANTANAIVKRDASGNFTAGTITAALSGNASTATALQTARTLSISGDATGSVTFDGTANADIALTISANSVALGTDTTGNYVATIAGTTNQISVSGSGSETAAVTLSLPQNIHSGATPSFAGASLSGNLAMGSNYITGLADPVNAQDAATKAYVDAARSGLDVKQSVRAATTANITLSGTQTVDGVALAVGNRVLVKNQTTATQNGIYVVASGAWSRATDADEPNEVSPGLFLFVEEGSTNSDSGWVITSDNPLTVGTDAIVFTQFSGTGMIIAGNALTKTGNTLDVVVAASGGIEIVSDALQLASSIAGNGLSYSSGVLSLATTSAGAGLSYTSGVLAVNTTNGLEISGDNVQLASTVAGTGLTYTNGVLDVIGTADRITANANSIDIASTYVGQTSITTLGTITTGTWQGSVIADAYINDALTISGGTVNNTPIGATTRSTGAFTTLAANGAVSFTSTLAVSNGVALSSTLAVTGNITASANITGSGTSVLSGFDIDGGTYA